MKINIAIIILSIVFGYKSQLFANSEIVAPAEDTICIGVDTIQKESKPNVWICEYNGELPKDKDTKPGTGNSPARVGVAGGINNPAVPSSVVLDKSCAPGEIEIISGVSDTGAKTYEVPIKVAPGINDFQPNISLVYNSMAGNSSVGYGWAISGIPTITRGGKSMYYDRRTDAIRFDFYDTFFLDGIRLIETYEDSTHIDYESEQGNILVTGNIQGSDIVTFDVYYPDGKTAKFGYTTPDEHALEFPVSSITDLYGNSITYLYKKDGLCNYIWQILYNGSRVEFTYRERQDKIAFYTAGTLREYKHILESINFYYGNSHIGEYSLEHEMRNNVSLLSNIEYSTENTYLNPLSFYYGEGNRATGYSSDKTQLLRWYETEHPLPNLKIVRGRFGPEDNDDGLIVLPRRNPYYHNINDSNPKKFENYITNKYETNDSIFIYTGLKKSFSDAIPEFVTGAGFVDILCADIAGVNKDYIIKINNYTQNTSAGYVDRVDFTVYHPNIYAGIAKAYTRTYDFPTIFTDVTGKKSVQPKYFYSGDFNGDGKMEIMAVALEHVFGLNDEQLTACYIFDLENDTYISFGDSFKYRVLLQNSKDDGEAAESEQKRERIAEKYSLNTDRLFTFDANGDGKTDVCIVQSKGTSVYTFDNLASNNLGIRLLGFTDNLTLSTSKFKEIIPGDFNGDGLTDLVVSPEKNTIGNDIQWTMFYSKGNGEFQRDFFKGVGRGDPTYVGFITQDINTDGLTDLIQFDQTGFTTYFTYNGYPNSSAYRTYYASLSVLVQSDINSFNKFSRLISLDKGVVTKYTPLCNQSKEWLLTGMVNCFGQIERNEYRSLCETPEDGPIYDCGEDAVFPYVNLMEPMMVLTATETVVDGQIFNPTRFEYENAVAHRQGLGFRGFEKVITYDSHDNRTVKTFDPYNHCVLKSVVGADSESSFDYDIKIDFNKLKHINLISKSEKNLLTGFSKETSYTHDGYGFPLSEVASHSDGITITKKMTYANCPNDTYSIGFMTNLEVTTKRGADESTERKFLHIYDRNHRQPIHQIEYVNDNVVKNNFFYYDSFGNLTQLKETPYSAGKQFTTTRTYDEKHRVSSETDPYGRIKTYTYDSRGNLSGITEETGTTSIEYDEFGRETLRTYPDGTNTTTIREWSSYPAPGISVTTTTTSGKPETSEYYDAAGRIVRTSDMRFDGKTRKIDYRYDIHGNLEQESLPFTGLFASEWKEYEYDRYDRLRFITHPSGNDTQVDYSDASVTTYENNIGIKRTYDSLGNLVASQDDAGEVSYYLAADGQPISVLCPGDVCYQFSYDKYRRQNHVEDPSAGVLEYEYDSWGNISKRTSADKTISYEYDDLNRLKKVVYPEFTTSYSYDNLSRPIAVVSDNGTSKRITYDEFGREKSLYETAVDGVWLQKDFTYQDGNIGSVKYTTQNGELATEEYIYSNGTFREGKINGKSIYRLDQEDANGYPTIEQTCDITREYSYNYGFPENITASFKNKYIQNLSYDFDPYSTNLKCRWDLKRNTTEKFSYDELNRLTAANAEVYTYNALGNITDRNNVGSFEYNHPDKPHAITGIDSKGYFEFSSSQEISYTSFCRPEQILQGNYKANFIYNGDHDRVKSNISRLGSSGLTIESECTYYLGDCYEFSKRNFGNFEYLYLFGDYYDAPAMFVKGEDGEDYVYILRDYLGSVTHYVDSEGEVYQEMEYGPWGMPKNPSTHKYYGLIGKTSKDSPAWLFSRGFCGHEHLLQFGLINMNARLYDPLVGRFLSPDPYVQMPDYTQGLNRFTYAMNNPFSYVDRDGEYFWVVVGVAAVIGGAINVGVHWNEVKAGGFWTGASYFLTGAAAGGLGAAVGVGAAVGFGNMLGVTAASYTAATTGFVNGAAVGAATGATSGFILESGNSLIAGNNFGNAMIDGLWGAGTGALGGAVTGGITGGIQARQQGANFWTGAEPDPKNHFSVYYGKDNNGDIKYAGMTGRDPKVRFNEHLNSGTDRAKLDFKVQKESLSKLDARIWEQLKINKYGMTKNGGKLYNLRNEISPKYWDYYKINNIWFRIKFKFK